nr:MAG TPA: hypothetical protein [Caudoviricetes sp.]
MMIVRQKQQLSYETGCRLLSQKNLIGDGGLFRRIGES